MAYEKPNYAAYPVSCFIITVHVNGVSVTVVVEESLLVSGETLSACFLCCNIILSSCLNLVVALAIAWSHSQTLGMEQD